MRSASSSCTPGRRRARRSTAAASRRVARAGSGPTTPRWRCRSSRSSRRAAPWIRASSRRPSRGATPSIRGAATAAVRTRCSPSSCPVRPTRSPRARGDLVGRTGHELGEHLVRTAAVAAPRIDGVAPREGRRELARIHGAARREDLDDRQRHRGVVGPLPARATRREAAAVDLRARRRPGVQELLAERIPHGEPFERELRPVQRVVHSVTITLFRRRARGHLATEEQRPAEPDERAELRERHRRRFGGRATRSRISSCCATAFQPRPSSGASAASASAASCVPTLARSTSGLARSNAAAAS